MSKISYVLKRIRKMNYQKMFAAIKEISQETKKSKLFIFNDMIYCGFKYQAGYSDYKLYKMYNMIIKLTLTALKIKPCLISYLLNI